MSYDEEKSQNNLNCSEIADLFPNALYVIKDDVIIDCNTSALKVFGYKQKKELIGLKPYELSPERQLDGQLSLTKGREIVDKAHKNEFIDFKWLHQRKNGENFIADIKIYKRKDLLYAVIIDINELEKLRDELKTKEYAYRLIFDTHRSVMLLINPETGNIIDANNAAILYYGYEKKKILSMKIQDINVLSDKEIKEEMKKAQNNKRNYFLFTHRMANGELRDVEVHSFPVRIEDKKLLFSIIHDINEKITERSVLDIVFNKSSDAVAIINRKNEVVNINDRFIELFQFDLEEIKGKHINEFICPYKCKGIEEDNLDIVFNGELIRNETRRKRKDGKCVDVELFAYPIVNNNKIMGINLIYSDISEKKKIDRKIKRLGRTDSLTGLYNRDYFKEKLDRMILKSKDNMFGVLFIDLDNFKEINDTLSHFIGDRILINFSKRVRKSLGRKDLFARFGGDEFIILTKKNKQELLSFAKEVSKVFDEPFHINNNELYLSGSIGVAVYPLDGKESDTLLKNADIAMYKAKQILQKQYKIQFYSDDMKSEIEESFIISNYLRKATENNELSLYYQPILDIKNNKIIAAEALLRWKNSTLGFISPSKFIPIAEKTGQIHNLGKWVLENVCKQISTWINKGYKIIPIAINISVKQLENNSFTSDVRKIINKYNIDTNFIEFEITESVSAGNIDGITRTIKELNAMGIKISMDDFGTGYSSLVMLKQLHVDKLKIDKVFIDDIENNPENNHFLKVIISMAQNINLKIIAEGIENNKQLEFLKKFKCDYGQGYLFSKPLDNSRFENFLETD